MSRSQNRRQRTRSQAWPWLLPGLAALVTALVRLAFLAAMNGQPFSTLSRYYVDSWFYHRWALDILAGNFWGKDVFFLRPLYPYLLAGIYRVFGIHILAVQLVQTAMAVLSCLLLYAVAKRIFNARAATLAAFGFALSPILTFYTGALLYVELTVFLSLLGLWLAQTRIPALAGLAFGLLVISRPELLMVLPLLFIYYWRSRMPGRTVALMAGLSALTIVAVPARNFIVARDPVLFTAHSGLNFYYGNNPLSDGTWQPTEELERGAGFSHDRLSQLSRTIDGRQLSWSQASSHWLEKGLDFIVHDPGRYLRLELRKLRLFFGNYEVPNNYYPELALAAAPGLRWNPVNFGLALSLGLVGMYLARRERKALPAYLFAAAYLVSALAFYVLSRLRAPVIPFLLIFSGNALDQFVTALQQRRWRRLGLGLGAALLVYLLSGTSPADRAGYRAQAWTQAGNIYAEMHAPAKAVSAFQQALAFQPDNAWTRYSLVSILASSGQAAEAETEYNRMVRTSGHRDAARLPLALARARLAIAHRDFARAARLYEASLAEDPGNAETTYLLGLVYISLDSLEPASYWLHQTLSLDPSHSAAAQALSAVQSRLLR